MTKRILLLQFITVISFSFGQHQKLVAFLGSGFQSVPTRTSIPYMETAPGCKFVPSTTIKGDTSGIVYQHEFLLFRNYEPAQKGIASYLKTSFVSNAEYLEFRNWVRDSIAREKIIQYHDGAEPVLKFILPPHGNETNHPKHRLNWATQFEYDDPQWIPALADMYLPQMERFYKIHDLDERKLVYHYFIPLKGMERPLDLFAAVIHHTAFWADKSVSVNDEYAVLGQVYDRFFPESPVIGVTGMQAHAFCHWKEVQLQNELDQKHLSYKVRVTLPLMNELTELPVVLPVPARDYTSQWKITVADYQAFVQEVKDSILAESLFQQLHSKTETREDALKLLVPHKEDYFDEGWRKFKKMEHGEDDWCRYLYPLRKNPTMFKKYKEQVQAIETRLAGNLDRYIYDRMDIREKAVVGKFRVKERRPGLDLSSDTFRLEIEEINPLTQEWVGMDLSINYMNKFRQDAGVRDHNNYARFILSEQSAITPGIPLEKQIPGDWVQGISYEQAMAYYHWKCPVWKKEETNTWQQYIYPSEEQFQQIQRGEQITIPAHEISYPSTVFRYVVTFFPAN